MKSIHERFTKRALLLFILIVQFSIFSFAATYYLSPTGNDATGNGTIGSPWFTLNKAWATVAAGDIIYLRGGTYAYNSQQKLSGKNGSAINTIKLYAYQEEIPVLTKSGSFTTPGFPICLIYIDADFTHWKGIEITGFTQATAAIWSGVCVRYSSNNIFEKLNVHHNGHGMVIREGCTNNLVFNCDFHENYDPLSTDIYGNGDGLEIGYVDTSATVTIRGCRMYYNSDDGLDLWHNDGNVIIENCWSWGNGYRENKTTTGGDGNGLKLGGTATTDGTTFRRTVKNCLTFLNRANGIDQNSANCKMYIYNNSSYANGKAGIFFTSYDNANIFRNNVSFANLNENYFGTHTNAIVDHNSYDDVWQPTGAVATSSDFVSIDTTGVSGARQANGDLPSLNFLKLAIGSDLIDKGINVGLSFDGSAPELGAFEKSSNITDINLPIVTAFTIPATSSSYIVSISTFNASDNIGVTGYLLTETSATPTSNASGWSSTKPPSYTFASIGLKSLYAWAKDAAGNVSAALKADIVISSPVATTFTFTGPSTGNVNSASANFTITPNNSYTGTITITPTGTASAGLTAKVLTFSNSSTAQTFSITPTVAGSIVLTPTNSGILTNASSLIYTANAVAPSAPTSVVAAAGNTSATVSFAAPTNNGGSAITGYTVTSIPAGGTDLGAGTTSLNHTITGLTNGTSYTFTVKATNSAGTSVASSVSNSVIPSAPAATTFTFTGPTTGNVNSASANFTITPNNSYTGTITITPTGTASAGLTAKVLTFSNSSTAQTFSITPTVAGSIVLTPTNSGILTNASSLIYTANAVAPSAPISVVAAAGNTSATVSFAAPTNNGGSAITGYTVTSIPAGGTDLNAGSTSLTHTITGLTNGTSYTFTVKASNLAGTSVASTASNSVIPSAPAATTFTFTGPTTGNVNSASANFTITPNNSYTGTITITPTGTASAGLTAKVLTFSNSSTAQTFSITPTVAGSIVLTPTNSGILTNASSLIYTANAVAPSAPTSVVAAAGNTSATVSFAAPTNNGGSAITGYTVTSVPAGGTDLGAGTTSLNHTITGLTNGTSYTFTVKATNSAGTSVASSVSNSVIPSAPVDNIAPIISVFSIPATSNSLTVSISAFTATDNTGVAGYLLTETSSIPSSSAAGWTALAPSSYNFLSAGSNSLYAWAKDAVGNISTSLIQVVTITLDVAPVTEYTQTLELKKGYNMISTYVTPSDSVVSDVTQPIVADGNLIKIQDESGNSYENWGSFGGWINNLGALQKTEGYKIKVAENCTLQITGQQIILPMDIPLNAGWNIISYPRTDELDAMMIVQSLIDQNKLIKVQDEAGNSIEDWGIYGGWKNGIGNFIPGKAYRIKMSASAVLTIQENYPKSANLPVYAEKTSHFSSQAEGNGVDHMNINLVGLNESGLSVGDELAAFDGDVCVGTLKITNSNLNIGSASLIASSSTSNQLKDGFKDGISVQLYVWDQMSGSESKVEVAAIKGSLYYNKNASILVKMKSLTTSVGTQNAGMLQTEVYPNPSQGRFTVRFSELPEVGSRIEVLDLSGRKVASRLITGISEELNLDGQAAGLYLVKSILGSREQIQKLVIQ